MSEDITKDPEYIKGYEESIQYQNEMNERAKTAYSQGWQAGKREKERGKSVILTVEYPKHQLLEEAIQLIGSVSEHNVQLVEEIKVLDERLKKLEKYTQE
jgi:hypothetical protein